VREDDADPDDRRGAAAGHNVQIAIFRQTQEDLHGEETVLQAILQRTQLSISEGRALLGRFLFSGDDVLKKTKSLSGGERSRLALALLSLIEGNLLLLDEPTNHLDLASQEILERALVDYKGTILLVSHDRSLLEAVTDKVWVIEGDRLIPHSYGYSEHRRRREERLTEGEKPSKGRSLSRAVRERNRQPDKYKLRRHEEERRAIEERIETLEERLADVEGGLIAASTAKDAYAAWGSLVSEWKEEG